jgi:phosphoribosylformylglycinamidine cyclo-ligase
MREPALPTAGPVRKEPAAGSLSYRDAGVDLEVAGRAKRRIGELVRATAGPEVVSQPGSFGGLYRMPQGLERPLLVSSADGVGTKVKVAMLAGRHDTVGEDLVNHCVNDILVEGAQPLFFLDYIGMGRLEQGTTESLVEGVARGCLANGCALIGGETAEMPDLYAPGEYDLAGFIVGVVEESKRLGAQRVRAGDSLLALAANGFHTNGYSLLRRLLFDRLRLQVSDPFPDHEEPVGDVLLRVHRSYLSLLAPLVDAGRLHALSHITGGGIPENLARVIPAGLSAVVDRTTWSPPPEFRSVMYHGGVEEAEMFRTFNMGVGMIVVVDRQDAADVERELRSAGGAVWVVGRVEQGEPRVRLI